MQSGARRGRARLSAALRASFWRTCRTCRCADELVSADAVRLAQVFDRPIYDCVYLALAHRIGATMLTAESRFANAVALTEHGEAVMTLADYAETR